MKRYVLLSIILFLGSCKDNPIEPVETETVFHKVINEDVFDHKITATVETVTDTLFDKDGQSFLRTSKVASLFLDQSELALPFTLMMIASSNLEFSDTLDAGGLYAGLHRQLDDFLLFEYQTIDLEEEQVCIKGYDYNNDATCFEIGIRLNKPLWTASP